MSKQKFTSPRGELHWVNITGNGKPDLNGKPKFSADLICTPEEAAPLVELIDQLWEEHRPKGAKAPKSTGYKEMEDGNIRFSFKTDTTYPSGDKKEIKVYDAQAKQVQLDSQVGNGSIGKVAGMAAVYDAGVAARGVTLYLDQCQIIHLKRYEGGAAEFEAEDDGDFVEEGFTAEKL